MQILDVRLMSEGAPARRCGAAACDRPADCAFELYDPPRWGHGLLCAVHANEAMVLLPVCKVWTFKEVL